MLEDHVAISNVRPVVPQCLAYGRAAMISTLYKRIDAKFCVCVAETREESGDESNYQRAEQVSI